MKIVLRTLILLCLVTWIGAELFFPFVAYFAFTTLRRIHIRRGALSAHACG